MTLTNKSFWIGLAIFTISLLNLSADSSYAPKILTDPSGNAVAVWETLNDTHRKIEAAVYTSGGGWSLATTISDAGADSFAPTLTMNSNGDVVAIWTAVNLITEELNLYGKELPSGGSWSSIINISTANIDVLDCRVGMYDPCYKISMNDSGDISVVWSVNGTPEHRIFAVTASFGGVWNAPIQISP